MKEVQTEIIRILPIQVPIRSPLKGYITSLKSLPPVLLIPYTDWFFLAFDGHHRTLARIEAGERTINTRILENSEDIGQYASGAMDRFDTHETLIQRYEKIFRPNCEAQGVRNFYDLWKILHKLGKI